MVCWEEFDRIVNKRRCGRVTLEPRGQREILKATRVITFLPSYYSN